MSSKRTLGLLAAAFGLLLVILGVAVLLSAQRFTIAQPLVILFGGGLLLFGIKAVKSAPAASAKAPVAPSVAGANPVGAVVALVLMCLSGWYYFGGGLESHAAQTMQEIQNKVAADAVAQYGIAHRNGSPMDSCVQAGFVAAAFLQAKDEAHYQQWKKTEKGDCAKAGLDK